MTSAVGMARPPRKAGAGARRLRNWSTACLVASDAVATLAGVMLAWAVHCFLTPGVDLPPYLRLWPFFFLLPAAYGAAGLYSGVSWGSPEELRRITAVTALAFLLLEAAAISLRGSAGEFSIFLPAAALFTAVVAPVLRGAVRARFGEERWWGYPAVIFGASPAGARLVRDMLRMPELGLKPAAVISGPEDGQAVGEFEEMGMPVLSGREEAERLVGGNQNFYAVLVMSGSSHDETKRMLDVYGDLFGHVMMVPDLPSFPARWVHGKSFGGVWGLELRRSALEGSRLWIKRALDLVICALIAPVAVPIAGAAALAVKLSSPGPLLFGHRRIGRHGREFLAWKFRTMRMDGDALLEAHLNQNPAAREEWNTTRKLRNDPRVPKVAAWLRKASLDELPQLWNVLRGDMSIVGPRPIVRDEVRKYGPCFSLYQQVPGGITGLWQVSGRNDTSYAERVFLDEHYCRNWSVWLDLCILFRTIGVVLTGRGAY